MGFDLSKIFLFYLRTKTKSIFMPCAFIHYQGTLVVAPTMHLAFDDTVYLERTCMYQLMALNSVGGDKSELAHLDQASLDRTTKYYTN